MKSVTNDFHVCGLLSRKKSDTDTEQKKKKSRATMRCKSVFEIHASGVNKHENHLLVDEPSSGSSISRAVENCKCLLPLNNRIREQEYVDDQNTRLEISRACAPDRVYARIHEIGPTSSPTMKTNFTHVTSDCEKIFSSLIFLGNFNIYV